MTKIKYKLRKNISWEEIGGEIVIFKLDTGKYFRLNGTASVIWKKLMEDKELAETKEEFLAEFAVNDDDFNNDLTDFTAELENEGIIVVDE